MQSSTDLPSTMAEAWVAWQFDLWRPWFELWLKTLESWPATAGPLSALSWRGTEQLA